MIEVNEQLVEELKTEYKGKWIAVKGRRLLATAEFHEDIYRQLSPEELHQAYIFYSPTDEQKKYGFLFRV